ncbi:hypothetical protein AAHA92_06601 [Salvia divinorum]|uniref:Titin-like n=1 Tax=Salvia divinorum TaxID=28513 RepID=A0ABD1I693_SALDI
MATDADIQIPLPVCEARAEQLENVVDSIFKISVSEVPQEKQNQVDKHNELLMVKDVSKVVESTEESQQNAEVSNNMDGDEDIDVVPEKCSMDSSVAIAPKMKVRDTIDVSHTDDAVGVTQLSKETSNDHHGKYDSSTENVALTKEILLESSLMGEETESHTPCILKSEKLNLQSKSSDDKSADGKPREEDLLSNLTNKMALYQDPIENERSVEYNFNTTAEKESHKNISPQETITTLELNTPLSKEEETFAQRGDKLVTISEDHASHSKKTLSESHGDVECQSQTPEDVATCHNEPKLVEQFEVSSPVQVEDAQIERDWHFEEESERLPLIEVSTEGPTENVALVSMDNVKDMEDLKEVESFENEQNTSILVKEDMHKGDLAESFHVSPENIEVSDLSQEDNVKAPQEEQSRNVTLQGNTIKANEATINADDRHKESLEFFPTIVSRSHEEISMNAILKEGTNVHTDGKLIEEVDNHKEVLKKTDQIAKDGSDTLVDRPVESAANEEISAKENQWSAEESNNTDKYGDIDAVPEVCSTNSSVAISEIKVRDTRIDPDSDIANVVIQISKVTSSDHHGTNDSFTENVTLTNEILQKFESHTPCISEGSEDKESNIQVITTNNKSMDEKPIEKDISCNRTNEVSKDGESDIDKMTSEQEELEKNKSVENSISGETIITLETSNSDKLWSKSDLNSLPSNEEETTVQKSDEPVTTSVDYGVPSEMTLSESHADVECQYKTLEDAATNHSDEKVTEKSEEISVAIVEVLQIDHNEHLEEESEGPPLTEASTWGTNDKVSEDNTGEVKEHDEDHKEAKLFESEQGTKCTFVAEDVQIENITESLTVPLENIKVYNISQENNIEEQSTNAHLHGNTIKAEEVTIDAAEGQKDSRECFLPIVSDSPKKETMNAVLQEVTSDSKDKKIIDEVDKHEEVSENLSTTVSTEDAEGNNSLVKLEGSETKKEDDPGKESDETPLPLPLALEASDASTFWHEACVEDGEPKKAEFCADEMYAESMLPKKESIIENTGDVHVDTEETKVPDSVDKISEAEKKENVENVPTIIPNEKTEEDICIHFDGQELENEQQSSIKDYPMNSKNDEVIVEDNDKIQDEEPSGVELFENDKNTESVLLIEEVQSKKPVESLHADAVLEDIKISDFDQCTEATGVLEEQIPSENSPSDEIGIDAANTNEKTRESQNVSNEDSDKDLLIKVADSEMTYGINLEEELETPSLTEASKDEAIDNKSILLEPKTSDEFACKVEFLNDEKSTDCTTPKKESFQPRDHKTPTSSAAIETTCSLEEQSLRENSQTIISDKLIEAGAAEKHDLTLENVAKGTPHEHIEENLVTQVDCSAGKHEERMEGDNQSSSLIEAPAEDANVSESDEPKNWGEESLKSESENGENTKSTYVKEETDVETPIDHLQVKPEDIKQHDSISDINKSIEEETSNSDPQEISTDKAERKSVDATHAKEENVETKDVAKEIPDCDKEDRIPIEEVGSQNPLNEALAGNANDEKSTKITEDCLIRKEEPLKSLQVADQDTETPPSSQDRETCSLDEECPTSNPEAIIDDNKEEIPNNTTGEEDETPKDKNIVENILEYGKEDNMPIEEVGSRNTLNGASTENANIEESPKINECNLIKEEASLESLQAQEIETTHLSLEREISSPDERRPLEGIKDDNTDEIAGRETSLEGETNHENIANTSTYEEKEESMQVQEDCSQQEYNESENIPSSEAPAVSCTESSPVKEEERVEIPTEKQILTANPQGTCDETQENTVDAANKNNDVVISIQNGDNEDNTPVEVDGLQKHSSEEVPAQKINDDEPTTTHEVADEDVTDNSSDQDRKPSHLEEQAPTKDSHETMGDERYAKTFDSTDLKQATLEDENYAATPDEDTKEDSRDQVDDLLLEHEEHSSTSLSDAPKDEITESTLVKEVAEDEDPVDSSQVATEDIKAFAPCQDTKISSTVDQIIDTKDISSNKITEKTIDATGEETQETQDIAKSASREYGSPNEQNTEAILTKENVSIGLNQIVGEESRPAQEEEKVEIPTEEQILTATPHGTCDETQEKIVDAANSNNDVVISVPNGDNDDNSPIDVDRLQEPSSDEVPAEKNNDDEPTTTYEVADEDDKDTSGQDRKSSHLEEQASTKDSHKTMGDERYAKTFDSTDLKQEPLDDENYAATPDEDTKDDSRYHVDYLLMEREEPSVKDSVRTSVSDAPKDDITGSMLAKEIAYVEDTIDSSQVVTEDIKAFAPCKDTKDISSNKITEKTVDATGEESQVAQDIAKSVPWEDDSPNEKNTEATLIKEDQSIELPRVVAEDIEEPCSVEIRETNSREEQIPCASSRVVINDNEEKTTIDPTIFENETPKNEVPKEMRSVDVKEETKEEECYLKAVQMTTAVILVSNQERSLNLTAKETTCTEDLNVNKVTICHIPEVSDDKQQVSPVTIVPEENMMTSNKHVLDGNSIESGVSEKINDQVDGEANSCGDKTDFEKTEVLNDGPSAVPTSETLGEIESRGRTETDVQVPNGENEAQFKQETENDQNIETAVPNYAASENASELKEVNGEEEIASNKCAEILHSPISVASEEVSTFNVALEEDLSSNSVTHLETKNLQEASAIKQITLSSAGQDAESISVEENSNYVCSSTKEKSDLNEVAFMPGENKRGLESSNRGLESIAQGQRCDIISKTEETKTEEEDLIAEAEIQSDKAVTEDLLKEETMKEDISREKEQIPRVPEVFEEGDEKALEEVEEKIFANEAIESIPHQEEQPTSIEEPTAKRDYENPRDIDIACVNPETQDSNKEAAQATIIPWGESKEHNNEDEICSSDEMQEHLILSEGKSKEEAKETYKESCVDAEKFNLSSQTKDISEISDVGQETPEEDNKIYTAEKSFGEDDPIKIKEYELSSASQDIKLTEQSKEEASITAEVQEEKAGIDLGSAVPVPEATGIDSQEVKELNHKCIEMADVSASTPDETSVMTASKKIEEGTDGALPEARDQQTKDIAPTEQLSECACITDEAQEAEDVIYLGAAVPVPEATESERQEVEKLNDKCTEVADTSTPVESSEISTLNSIGESTERTTLEAKEQQTKLRDFPEESNTRQTGVKMADTDDAVNLQSVRDISEDVQDQELCKESFGMSNNQNPVEGDPEERAETSEGKEANPIQAAPVSGTLEQDIEEQKLGRDTVDVHEEETNISIPNQLKSICGVDTEKLPESSIHQSSVENTDHCDKEYTDQCDRSIDCSQQEQNESENIPSLEALAVSCTENSPVIEEEKVEIPTDEQILTANPQGRDETQEKTDDAANKNNDVVISIPNGNNEDNSPIEVGGLQEHPSEEVPAEKINDDESTITHGFESANENAVKVNLNENEEKLECSHVNEVYIQSLQVEDEDVTDTSSGQSRKSSHLEEQASTEHSHETIGDERYAKTFDSTDLKQEILEDENYVANPDEYTKGDTRDQVDDVLLEKEEPSEKDSESTLLPDGPKVDITESALVMEVAEVEDPIDSSQVATKDIKAFDPCQDTEKTVDATGEETHEAQDIGKSVPREYNSPDEQNTEAILVKENVSTELTRIVAEESIPVQEEEKVEIPTEVQILTANLQGTCDETQEITVDAANKNNDVVISIPNGDNEDNAAIEVGGLQEPSSEEVPAEKINDDEPTTHEVEFAKTFDSTDMKQETVEDDVRIIVNYADTSDEDTKEDSRNQVYDLLMEREEHLVQDSESTSVSDAPKDDITESTLVKEVAEVDDPIGSSQVVNEDIKAFAPCQDTEISSTVEKIIDSKDISSNKMTEKTVDAAGEETQEAQDIAKSVPREDDSPNEQETESTLIKEDLSIELPRIVAEDIEEPCSSEIRETNSREEQIPCASPGLVINDNEEKKTIDPTIFENEIPKNEVPKEMGSVDVKGEAKEEECYLKAVQMTTAVIAVSDQERSLNLTAKETPCTEDLNINKFIIGHITEVTDDKPKDSPVMKVPEENMMASNEHVLDGNSMESGVSDKINDQVDGEANSCGDTDLEKIEVLNDGPSAVTSETLAEMESRSCTETEVKVPNREKEAEFKPEAENNQKNIDTALPSYAASENVSESKEVDGKEDITSNSCEEILSCPVSVASEEVSTSNAALEEDSTSNTVTHIETKNVQEAPSINETTPSSAEGQHAESVSVEENSNYVCSSTKEKSDSNEVALMLGENKSGLESSNRGPESVAQGQRCDIISKTEETKTEEGDHKADIQSDKAVTEDILQEETTCEKESMKEDISRENEQLPRINEEHEDIKDYHQRSYEDKLPEVSEEVEEKILANEAIERILQQEEQRTVIEEPTTKIDFENPHDLDIACVNTDTQDSNKEAVQTAIIPGGESVEQNKEDETCSSDEVQVKDEEQLILSEGKTKEAAKETYKEACVEAETFDPPSQTKVISECAISVVGQETPEEDNKIYTAEESFGEDDPIKIKEYELSSASQDIKLTEQSKEDASITAEVQEEKAGIDLGSAVPVPEATGIDSQEVKELNHKCIEMADASASTPDETSVMTASKKIEEGTDGALPEARDQQTKDIAPTEQLSECACITDEAQEAEDVIYLGAAVPVPEATESERQEVEKLNDKCTEVADTSTPVESSEISTLNSIGESTERTTLEAKEQQTKLRDFPEESNTRQTGVKMADTDDAVNLQSVRDISEDVQDQELCKESFGMSNNQNPVEGDPEERAETSEGKEANPIQAAPVSGTLEQDIEEQKLGRDTVDVHEEETNISIPNQLKSICGVDTEKLPESSIHQSSVENTDHCDKEYTDQCDRSIDCSQQEQNESENIPSLEALAVSCTENSPVIEEEKVEIPTDEQILTANPQGRDETQEKTDDAANKNNDVVISIPNGNNEDNSPIEVGGLQEHPSEEVPAEKINDDESTITHGFESANENAVKVNLNENEEKLECSHVNEVYIQSLQVEDEDVTDTSSGQSRKSSHLEEQASTEHSHETIGDERYAKTFDSTDLKQEILEDENYVANPDEYTKGDTRDQVDDVLLEKEEPSEKDSESTLLPDGPKVDITESALVMEVAEVEDPIDSSQVATKDIKAFDPCQDTEKTVDATGEETQEAQDIAKGVPREYNSPDEQNTEAILVKENVSTELTRIVAEESIPVQEEEKVEIPTELQILTANLQGTCDETQEITVDAANKNNDVVISIPNGDNEDNPAIEVGGLQEPSSEDVIYLVAAVPVPEATESERQEVEKLNDKCTEVADTSTPVESSEISTLNSIGESTERTTLEAKEQQTKLRDFPEETNTRQTGEKMADTDDAVNLQSVRDISEDVQDQELCKESFGVPNNHNPVEGDPEESTETSEGKEANLIQAAPVSETLEQKIEEHKFGRDTVDVLEEEKNISIPNQLESVYVADTEKVPESSIHQNSAENTDQCDKKQGNQQIDSPLVLPCAQCPDIKTAENEPQYVGGLANADVPELEAFPLSLKDKHVVQEADDIRYSILENLDGDKNISAEYSQGEHEIERPSKVQQEGEECGNEERKGKQIEGKPESEETDKPSLSDLLQVSTRETSEMADHSPTEKEPTSHTEDMRAENTLEVDHENTKTDEKHDDEDESREQKKSDLGSEAPVMVDIGDTDMKVAHKKSHNILSGVGSKVKHSIAKVKKAITGKSPKKVTTPESK